MKKLGESTVYRLEPYDSIPHDEVLFRGLSEEAFKSKGLSPIRPFSVFMKDAQDQVLGGISGTTFYGSLYIDSLWLHPSLRHQGWGTKLMQAGEKIGKDRGVRFAIIHKTSFDICFVRKNRDFLDRSKGRF